MYYEDDWAVSVTKKEFESIANNKRYHVIINSKKYNGSLKVAEANIAGKKKKSIFFLSHICQIRLDFPRFVLLA